MGAVYGTQRVSLSQNLMKKDYRTISPKKGFSLAEVIITIVIAAMIMVAVLMIYDNVRNRAESINQKLGEYILPNEILHRIAEDIDRIVAPGSDAQITINNKYENGFSTGQLIIISRIYDNQNRPQIFEKVVWQSNYDPDMNRLMLYRSHSGITEEDKFLSQQEAQWRERKMELFVPLCTGVSFFRIEAIKGQNVNDKWSGNSLPGAVVATISFGQPIESPLGGFTVAETEMISRTIAIDRTRKMKFTFVKENVEL